MNNQVLVDHDCIGYDVVGLYHWNQLKMLCFFNEIGSIFRYMLGKIEILPAAGEFFWIFQLLNLIFFEIFKPPPEFFQSPLELRSPLNPWIWANPPPTFWELKSSTPPSLRGGGVKLCQSHIMKDFVLRHNLTCYYALLALILEFWSGKTFGNMLN